METRDEWKARMGIGLRNTVAQLAGGEGTTRTTVVADETKPRVAGYQIEHWSGRVDARVTPEPVQLKAKALRPW